jgi:murein DD-endopeptidase MepM/ murein hydrolase activator NlpD
LRAKKTLSSWLANRYILIIRNEENFAEKTSFSFTYGRVIFFSILTFVFILFLSLFLVKTLLSQWFDPRHAQIETNRKLFDLTIQVDSLALEAERKDLFIRQIQRILTGDTLAFDEEYVLRTSEANRPLKSPREGSSLAPIDSIFRQEFEQADFSFATVSSGTFYQLQELFFYSPVSGFVSSSFNMKEGHLGADIVTRKNEPVKCVADGTVILASWTQDGGYVMAVQHRGNIVSVYKHNAELLKKVGNFVSGGEIIAIVGNSGELTDGPHLHFELWYNGNPVNPEEFISF